MCPDHFPPPILLPWRRGSPPLRRRVFGPPDDAVRVNLRRTVPLVAALVCLGLGSLAAAQTTTTPPEGDLRGASDHVLVKVSSESSASTVLDGDSRLLFGGWHRVPIAPASNARDAVATLSNNPHVEEVSLDPAVQLDPVYPTRLDLSAAAFAPKDP